MIGRASCRYRRYLIVVTKLIVALLLALIKLQAPIVMHSSLSGKWLGLFAIQVNDCCCIFWLLPTLNTSYKAYCCIAPCTHKVTGSHGDAIITFWKVVRSVYNASQ